MKRILILALVAITVVACEQKNEEISRHDKNALKLVTVDAVQLLGKNSAAVEKSLLKAGFVLVADTTKTQMPALRANMPEMINMPQKITPNRVSTYEYGDEDGLRTKGDTYIIAYAVYYEDVFALMQCNFFKKIDDKINLLYKELVICKSVRFLKMYIIGVGKELITFMNRTRLYPIQIMSVT